MYRAVIFDLFGTLAEFSFREYEATLARIAQLPGAPVEPFVSVFQDTLHHLESGTISWQEALEHACRSVGASPVGPIRERMFQEFMAFPSTVLEPRKGVAGLISRLKMLGLKIGLISNTYPPVPELWPQTELARWVDVAVFSCVEGIRKPDARIYHTACEGLGVLPSQCVFIGDGSNRELDGALQAGMDAIMCCVPDTDLYKTELYGRQAWEGRKLSTFDHLPALLA